MRKKVMVSSWLIFFIALHACFLPTRLYAAGKTELLRWEKVNILLPRYSIFTVLDLETGKKFKVQRRAGSRHADVQPLTVKDTNIMKEIYNGKWSWRRRAIIVSNGERNIAASMHGMPHGAGALQNNFPGHFCIHFYGSTTHRTNKMDLSHKLMILKAGGNLEKFLATTSPNEVALAFISGIKEHDSTITSYLAANKVNWEKVFKKVENVRVGESEVAPDPLSFELKTSVPVRIDWYLEETGKQKFEGVVKLIRITQFDGWKVDAKAFLLENGL